MNQYFLIAFFILALFLSMPSSFASDKPADQGSAKPVEMQASPEAAQDSIALNQAIKALLKDQDEVSQRHFSALYQTHNLTGLVKIVRRDIGAAVQACSGAHKDIAGKMGKRFDAWEAAVNSVLDDAQAHVNNMIIAQSYAEPQDISAILTMSAKLRAKSEGALDKVPVSTKEACDHLYSTLDKTQGNLVSMMRETLVSMPHKLSEEGEPE